MQLSCHNPLSFTATMVTPERPRRFPGEGGWARLSPRAVDSRSGPFDDRRALRRDAGCSDGWAPIAAVRIMIYPGIRARRDYQPKRGATSAAAGVHHVARVHALQPPRGK